MQRSVTHSTLAFFAGLHFLAMSLTAVNTGDLVVRTFACICMLAALMAAEATWHARSNAVKAVAVWSITTVVFGISVIFYSRAYPIARDTVTMADASIAIAVLLAFSAWYLRKQRGSIRRMSAKAFH